MLAYIVNNLGNVELLLGNYSAGLNYFKDSMTIREEIADKRGISASNITISNAYRLLGEYEKALHYQFAGLKLALELNYSSGMCVSLCQTGLLADNFGLPEDAVKFMAASAKGQESTGFAMDYTDNIGQAEVMERLRREMGDQFDLLWREGQSLEIIEAVHLVISQPGLISHADTI